MFRIIMIAALALCGGCFSALPNSKTAANYDDALVARTLGQWRGAGMSLASKCEKKARDLRIALVDDQTFIEQCGRCAEGSPTCPEEWIKTRACPVTDGQGWFWDKTYPWTVVIGERQEQVIELSRHELMHFLLRCHLKGDDPNHDQYPELWRKP